VGVRNGRWQPRRSDGGFLKPAYWGQWLWAQLPDQNERLAVGGCDESVKAIAFRDGDGVAVLVWYDAPENSPFRYVSVTLGNFRWTGHTARRWQLDSMRHVGYIPEGVPVELPCSVRSTKYAYKNTPGGVGLNMIPASMCLIKAYPLAADDEAVPPRPILLDNPTMGTAEFQARLGDR
jgi:hypothetical protein